MRRRYATGVRLLPESERGGARRAPLAGEEATVSIELRDGPGGARCGEVVAQLRFARHADGSLPPAVAWNAFPSAHADVRRRRDFAPTRLATLKARGIGLGARSRATRRRLGARAPPRSPLRPARRRTSVSDDSGNPRRTSPSSRA